MMMLKSLKIYENKNSARVNLVNGQHKNDMPLGSKWKKGNDSIEKNEKGYLNKD